AAAGLRPASGPAARLRTAPAAAARIRPAPAGLPAAAAAAPAPRSRPSARLRSAALRPLTRPLSPSPTRISPVNNSDSLPWWAYLLFLAGAGVLAYFAWRARQKKIAAYRAWAAQYGFHYEPRDDSVTNLSSENPFGTGRARQGIDVFRGRYKNLHIVFFQYN